MILPKDFQIRQETPPLPQLLFDDQIIQLGKRKATHNGSIDPDSDQTNPEDPISTNSDEQWEDELDECLAPKLTDIRGWDVLREQIKIDLEKKYKSLPLSQINQYMILRNFATLHLKGFGRIEASKEIALQWHQKLEGSSEHFARRIRGLARHYQIFEHLPKEKRGGIKNSRSVMKNETVLRASRAWLIQQKKGSVSPGNFQKGINEIILPSLNIFPSKPLCERTARRWLIKLGWQRTKIKKGVYVDGHDILTIHIMQYWGWAKYRYRQYDKNTFQQAKDAAKKALDACPVEVIQRFINRSWRWISAFRMGLTGNAAQWAVRKQKGHRSVSRSAMMHLDAVLI